jgi:hypothetical protein
MMWRSKAGRWVVAVVPILAGAALALPLASPAAAGTQAVHAAARTAKTPKHKLPRAVTGSALHVSRTSALLTGVVNPYGFPTSYYFQYGPTTAYGQQTPAVALPAGVVKVPVSQTIVKLQVGATYHFRLVVSYTGTVGPATAPGRDRSFVTKGNQPVFKIAATPSPTVFGGALSITGTLSGPRAAGQQVVLQASPFPYLEAFTNIGSPVLPSAAGSFSFRVANLSASTQYRVITLGARPLYSHVITEHVAVRVTFHARTARSHGLVRLYGTVTPAQVGARVLIQLWKAVRPGNTEKTSETTARYVTQLSTTVKRGSAKVSRFSIVASLHRGGRYRVLVKVRAGALVSGTSPAITLHATAKPKGKKKG